jgi:hypothetical protein
MPIANPRAKLLAAMLLLTAASLSAARSWGAPPDDPQDNSQQSDLSSSDILANCPPPINPSATPPRCPWYIQTTGIALQRDGLHATDWAALGNPSNIVLSTRDLDFPLKAGGQFLIGHTINSWNQVEFSYMASEHWSDSTFVRDESPNDQGGVGNLFSPYTHFGVPAVTSLDYNNFVSIEHKSTFQTAEINWRRYLDVPPGRMTMSTLLGVRYMEIGESFGYNSVSELTAPQGSQNTVLTDTGNRLLGVQIGATMECYVEGPWWINFEIKGAVCENDAFERTSFQHVDENGAATNFANNREHRGTSWIGDLALTCVYRFSPRASARVGYQAIFVDGVALADVNAMQDINMAALSPLGPGQLHQNSNVVYHGPFAGLQLAW